MLLHPFHVTLQKGHQKAFLLPGQAFGEAPEKYNDGGKLGNDNFPA